MKLLNLEEEGNVISRCFRDNGVSVRCVPPPVTFETGGMRIYYLIQDPRKKTVPPRKVVQMAPAIGEALTIAWNQRTEVMIRTLPLRIEVPRRDPVFISIRGVLSKMRGIAHGRPLALMGETYDWGQIRLAPGERRKARPFIVDMSKPQSPHILVAGQTGAGKSKWIQTVILGMAISASPAEVQIGIIDPKGKDFPIFSGFADPDNRSETIRLPHMMAPVAVSQPECEDIFGRLAAEINRRTIALKNMDPLTPEAEKMKKLGPTIVLFIDEVADLISEASAGSKIEETIGRFLQIGRGLGFHMILGTQKPSADYIKKVAKDKANVPVRVCGSVPTMSDAKIITGVAGSKVGAHLFVVGDFAHVQSSKITMFRSFAIQDDELPLAIAGIVDVWRGVMPAPALPSPPKKGGKRTGEKVRRKVGSGITATERSQRHAILRQVVLNTVNAGGEVTPASLSQYHRSKFGTALNHNSAVKIIAEAMQS